jgi:predicted RNase H-like HicB family nuclease
MPRYTILLSPETEVGGFSVTVPALPGVFTEGDTREDALANARDAIALFLEDMIEDGEQIPLETAIPELAQIEVSVGEAASSRGRDKVVHLHPERHTGT